MGVVVSASHLHKFDFSGSTYHYYTATDFLHSGAISNVKRYRKTKYANIGMSLDIETSKIGEYSYMYVWQIGVDNFTIIGRTYDELRETLDKISACTEHKIFCWVHNLSYEWAFIRNQIAWNIDKKGFCEVFALEKREVVKANYKNIEFRDSLKITNKKLERVATDYNLNIQKLTGCLNYDLIISPETPLKLCQIAYCINDVQILTKWFHSYIIPAFMEKGHKVPLTSTGIVRDEMKRKFKELNEVDRNKYKYRIRKSFPNQSDYIDLMTWVYRGGYVHCNALYTDITMTGCDMGSFDFKSSYPASLLHYKYPWRFIKKEPEFFEKIKDDRKWQNEKAFYGTFRFSKIRTRTNHTLESKNKIFSSRNAIFDNGRLSSADEIVVCLTELDYQNYNLMYVWESCECINLKTASKEPLPKFFLDMLLEYFVKKEELKGNPLEYALTKAKLNSVYGMCCTRLYLENLKYINGDFESIAEKDYKKAIENVLLLPYWGIWCCAYSRNNLIKNMVKLKDNCFYSDTDSLKIKNVQANTRFIEYWNAKMKRINNTMYTGHFDKRYFRDIGKFDFEGKLWKLKTLGAKRYLYSQVKGGMLVPHATVAGCVKGTLESKAKRDGVDIYDLFTKTVTLSENESKKLVSSYLDFPFEVSGVDYMGKTFTAVEKSCVTLHKTTFEMSLTKEYLSYYLSVQNSNLRIVGERTL